MRLLAGAAVAALIVVGFSCPSVVQADPEVASDVSTNAGSGPQVEAESSAWDATEEPVLESREEALRTDVKYLTNRYKVTVDEAVAAAKDVDSFETITPAIRKLIGGREIRTQVAYFPEPSLTVTISKGSRIPELDEIAREFPQKIDYVYQNTPGIEMLQSMVDRASEIWRDRIPNFNSAAVEESTNADINVNFDDGQLPSVALLHEMAPFIPKTVGMYVGRTPKTAQFFSRGGLRLKLTSNDKLVCTSGFVSTLRSTGALVLTTAAHCPDDLSYMSWSSSGSSGTPMPFGGYRHNTKTDAQYHYSGSVSKPWFHASSTSSYRTVGSRFPWSSIEPGQIVCKQGMTTGYSCGELISKHSTLGGQPVCGASGSNYCDNVWLAVNNLFGWYGDSGGPAFFSDRAVGLYLGSYETNNGVLLYVVTSVTQFQDGLGVDVLRG